MLKLKDAFARLEQARKQAERLKKSFNDWFSNKGIELVCERDPIYARYGYFVVAHKEPSENLGLIAGEIFNNLRSALDYVAFQIYLAGGGDRADKQAKSVAFPIVREDDKWAKAVAVNVPHAWDEAIEKLKWCQPFVQLPPNNTALTALQGVGATDKHREIVLCASALMSISGISPDLGADGGMSMLMAQPGPVVEVGNPGLLGMVYRHTGDGRPMDDDDLVKWGPGVELAQPPDPTVVFDFRANDNSHIQVDAIPHLIAHVGHILERFKRLKMPAKPTQ
jgi:hypothetical protein